MQEKYIYVALKIVIPSPKESNLRVSDSSHNLIQF